ncbi:MAG TPA: vanomycin resistance protein VanB [Desulfotomaculum sp.]|nr:MAG: VanW family protein [Desulfotomaculum sp. 46_80]HAG10692.1 vanomycin resistance protein VanB [Desulfotomaculum sp.]HBY04963.1 vanomycin resistance protein VanB [Desulfotomaculum sp.]
MKHRFPAVILLFVIITVVSGLGANYVSAKTDRVIPGIEVRNHKLQGLNHGECLKVLEQLQNKMLATSITLKCRGHQLDIPLRDLDLSLDIRATADDALNMGRTGTIFSRLKQRILIKESGYELPLRLVINKNKFEQKVMTFNSAIGSPAQDAAFRVIKGDRVEVVPARSGTGVNPEDAYKQLVDYLVKNSGNPVLDLNLVTIKPKRTTEMVESMGLKGLLAYHTTSFDPGNVGRTYNIRVAANALDGLLAPPGQEVSFNKVVGPRSSEAGYKNAKVIINGEFVDGIGGGVCQVSTTLYNAIILSNLEILERTNHSLPIQYIPIGRDATVVYGLSDLRFRNNTESFIYIRSFVSGGYLTFKVYGNTDYKIPVSISTKVVKVYEPETILKDDPNLKKGEQVVKQEGSKGYEVVASRISWEKGARKIEPLPKSIYRAVNKIIAVGIKEEDEVPVILPPDTNLTEIYQPQPVNEDLPQQSPDSNNPPAENSPGQEEITSG